ncbi:MAG: hypothetical protein ACHQUB_01520 [Candidatus Saccharimonadia bacterium]
MTNLTESERLRENYLELCEQLISGAKDMRNFAMKPGNAWLAKGELAKIIGLSSELETLLDQIKRADSSSS